MQARIVVPERGVDVSLDLAPGRVLAVFGPNGAGKSTVLGGISGVLRPEEAYVRVGSRVLTDTASGVVVPAHRRRVALLAQDPLLFPHLDVRANVEFAPRSAGRSRREARGIADRLLDAVDAAEFATRRPSALSGGQAARVALARALAADPHLLLLDEPMAALDVETAPMLRTLLASVLRREQRMAVVVTHDVLDALALADEVAVIDGGRVVERGSVHDVLTAPRSGFAASLAGLDLVEGVATETGVRAVAGGEVVGDTSRAPGPGEQAVAVFAPRAVSVYRDAPHGSPRNVFAASVRSVTTHAGFVTIRSTVDGIGEIAAEVTAAAATELELVPEAQVWLSVKATEVAVHPAAG
ncbi:ATP-binding cassette domain-containing protein [Rhodococcus rhodnii]|uniref:ATP-binding cassette domain-containing protein n=1 Tax=Rhodococcus rhodnii TaxID=38312 RepID=A0A6P2CHY6_9NOCA|nr:ATP-binding cassette domain-containing protein [Rhodococcus rhodnii]TXG92417.1 ATP-binding cassette domain-containing protein [Rhodococcus rhodnii]